MHRYCTTFRSHSKQWRGFFFNYIFLKCKWKIIWFSEIHRLNMKIFWKLIYNPVEIFLFTRWLIFTSHLRAGKFTNKPMIYSKTFLQIQSHKANVLTINIRSGPLCHLFLAIQFFRSPLLDFCPDIQSTTLAKVRTSLQICVDRFHKKSCSVWWTQTLITFIQKRSDRFDILS